MPFSVVYDVDGTKKVEHRMLGMAERAVAPEPILRAFAGVLREAEKATFSEQGPGWAPLKPSTVARRGSSEPILRDTDALFDSLTSEHATGAVEHVFGNELIFGTEIPYAIFHKTGTSRMDARDPLPLPNAAVLRSFSKALQAWLVGEERSEFGVGAFGAGITNVFGA